ncbi:MAG: protein kinase domain-containing protein [Actinomycetales bacterium]
MSLRPGAVIGSRYQLTRPIAVGGMGSVWEAVDTTLDRPVAIKILKPELSGDPTFLARFRAEARNSGALSHANIAAVFDYGETTTDTGLLQAYLVMELVQGEPLSTILTRDGVLPVDQVLSIMRQVGLGLAAAHAAGIVHRDIKPGNLLITPDGRVKITDFGIARAADAVPLTATGTVMGTARYLSPEQATGEATNPASDVYSLGVVAYEALAGHPPFTAESQVAQAMAHVHDEPLPLPEHLPPGVRALVMRMLAKYPNQRPADGAALVREVDIAASGGDPTRATTVLPPAGGADATRVMDATKPTEAVRRTPPRPGPAAGAAMGAGAMAAAQGEPRPAGPRTTANAQVGGSGGRPRRRLTGPLIALILLVLFVALGAIFADVFNRQDTPQEQTTVTETLPATPTTITTTSTTTSTTSLTTTTTPTETPTSSTEPTTQTTTTTTEPAPAPTTQSQTGTGAGAPQDPGGTGDAGSQASPTPTAAGMSTSEGSA